MRLIAMNLLLGLTIWPATLSAQTLPAPSTWKNARGSVLTISGVDSEGKVTGTFVNMPPAPSVSEGPMRRPARSLPGE